MAQKIDNITTEPGKWGGYPWNEWMDGSAWRITQGQDFTCTVATMRSNLISRANRSVMRVVTRVNGDRIDFQFIPRTQSPSLVARDTLH